MLQVLFITDEITDETVWWGLTNRTRDAVLFVNPEQVGLSSAWAPEPGAPPPRAQTGEGTRGRNRGREEKRKEEWKCHFWFLACCCYYILWQRSREVWSDLHLVKMQECEDWWGWAGQSIWPSVWSNQPNLWPSSRNSSFMLSKTTQHTIIELCLLVLCKAYNLIPLKPQLPFTSERYCMQCI